MRDDSVAVAGRLTGHWRFPCPRCKVVHRQTSSIERCSSKFSHVLLGNDVRIHAESPIDVNEYAAARHGLLDEWAAANDSLPRAEFKMPVEVAVKAETMGEATLLMLEEFSKFVASATAVYREAQSKNVAFMEKYKAAPLAKMGVAVVPTKGWVQEVKVGGHDFGVVDGLSYYLDLVPKEADPALAKMRENVDNFGMSILALSADEDLLALSYSTKYFGIKVVNGVGKLAQLGTNRGQKALLEDLRNA